MYQASVYRCACLVAWCDAYVQVHACMCQIRARICLCPYASFSLLLLIPSLTPSLISCSQLYCLYRLLKWGSFKLSPAVRLQCLLLCTLPNIHINVYTIHRLHIFFLLIKLELKHSYDNKINVVHLPDTASITA